MNLTLIERKVLRFMAQGHALTPPYTGFRGGTAVIQWHLLISPTYIIEVDYPVLMKLVQKGLLSSRPPDGVLFRVHSGFRLTDTGLYLGFYELERRKAHAH